MVNLNSLSPEKTERAPRIKHLYRPIHEVIPVEGNGSEYDVISATSGKTYRVVVNIRTRAYHCQCPGFTWHLGDCSHGKAALEWIDEHSEPVPHVLRVMQLQEEWERTNY